MIMSKYLLNPFLFWWSQNQRRRKANSSQFQLQLHCNVANFYGTIRFFPCVAVCFVFKSQFSEHRTLTIATLSIWWFQLSGNRTWGGGAMGGVHFICQCTNLGLPHTFSQFLLPGIGWEEPEANPFTPMRLGWDPDARASDLVLEGRVSGIRLGTDFHIQPHDPPFPQPKQFLIHIPTSKVMALFIEQNPQPLN